MPFRRTELVVARFSNTFQRMIRAVCVLPRGCGMTRTLPRPSLSTRRRWSWETTSCEFCVFFAVTDRCFSFQSRLSSAWLLLRSRERGRKGHGHGSRLLPKSGRKGLSKKKKNRFLLVCFMFCYLKNHPVGLYNLGCCYEDGDGVEQSTDRAVEYYQRAALLHYRFY